MQMICHSRGVCFLWEMFVPLALELPGTSWKHALNLKPCTKDIVKALCRHCPEPWTLFRPGSFSIWRTEGSLNDQLSACFAVRPCRQIHLQLDFRQAVIVQSRHDGARDVQIRSSLKPPSFTFLTKVTCTGTAWAVSSLINACQSGCCAHQVEDKVTNLTRRLDAFTGWFYCLDRPFIYSNLATKVIQHRPGILAVILPCFPLLHTKCLIYDCRYYYLNLYVTCRWIVVLRCHDSYLFAMSMTLSLGHSRFSVQLGVTFLGRCQIRAGQSCMLVKEEHCFLVVLGCFWELYGFVLCDFMHVSPCE